MAAAVTPSALVLFAGRHDWANVSNRIARAMNATAGRRVARVYTETPHPFGYPEDERVADPGHLAARLGPEDWLIWTGDGDYAWWLDFLRRFRPRAQLATQHVGKAYRTRSDEFNARDTECGARLRFVSCDLLRLATSGPPAVPRFAPYDAIEPRDPPPIKPGERIRVAHSPSNNAKGTDTIRTALGGLPVEVDVIHGVSFAECLARRRRAHIFVDQFVPEVGAFGQSATEALAQGCAVVSSIGQCEPAWEVLERPPVLNVASPGLLHVVLRSLAEDPLMLDGYRLSAVDWSRRNCSPAAVAGWYWKHLR
jgi:hypothetical protein